MARDVKIKEVQAVASINNTDKMPLSQNDSSAHTVTVETLRDHIMASLPVASASQLGGVKQGSGLSIDTGGTISVDRQPMICTFTPVAGQYDTYTCDRTVEEIILAHQYGNIPIGIVPDGEDTVTMNFASYAYPVLSFANVSSYNGTYMFFSLVYVSASSQWVLNMYYFGKATSSEVGLIKPDGTTISVDADGAISAMHDHTHSNKSLLDTYTQTEEDMADAVTKKHAHFNKKLIDAYTQTEANLSDAVSKKHEHANKSLLDLIPSALGTALKSLRVNSDGTALEWGNPVAAANWGFIEGTLSNQTDLQTALDEKENTSNKVNDIETANLTNSQYIGAKTVSDKVLGDDAVVAYFVEWMQNWVYAATEKHFDEIVANLVEWIKYWVRLYCAKYDTIDSVAANALIDLNVRLAEPINNIAPLYDPAQTYPLNAPVMMNRQLYRCSTAISSAEPWTPSHWTPTTIAELMNIQ